MHYGLVAPAVLTVVSYLRAMAAVVVASRSQDKVDNTVASLKALGAKKAAGFTADVRNCFEPQTRS
ncbi:MAG: hypothetical protein U5M23_13655 [Marinagarivorans sp.]|nr:hypothetical protein [Marinagarivorans sp.]